MRDKRHLQYSQVSSAVVMTAQSDLVKVLEQCRIAAPPNSVPTTSFPLTLMDIHWLYERPSECLFMYQIPLSAAQFADEILPVLKNSLSLALERFFPLCGNLVCPPHPSEPYILYNDGDSVTLLVAQSAGAFSDFLEYGPRDPKAIHLLVPAAPPTRVLNDSFTPLLAVQVTLFPNSGLGIGITHRHIVADGVSFFQFVKTWASICKANCDTSNVSISPPVHDKGIIKDPNGIKDAVLNMIRGQGSPTGKDSAALPEDSTRATFTLCREEMDQLKKWVATKYGNGNGNGTARAPNLHLSSYVVTSAFVWVCIIKSLDLLTDDLSKDGELCHFGVVGDGRNKYDACIPATFFGNCIIGTLVSVARSKFRQEDSVAVVAEAISQGVQSLNKQEVLYGDLNEASKWMNAVAKGENILTVAGSPRTGVYETDFGWGRPGKFHSVHIDISGSISLFDSGKEKGGIEIGLCRSKHQMEVFTSFFRAGINQFVVL